MTKHTHINGPRLLLLLVSTYLIFAVLLNSVGSVILQSILSFDVSKPQASVLEGFKDIPIAVVSFLFAAYLPRWGYRRALVLAMVLVATACVAMPLLSSFWMTKVLFLTVGVSFALVKVSVYSLLSYVNTGADKHAANMNVLEGCFMLGVLAGYWLFGAFIDQHTPASLSWLNVYWVLALACGLNLIFILTSMPDIRTQQTSDNAEGGFVDMLKLATLPFVVTFVLCAFLYVLIEQGLGTWLPTFNNEVLGLPANISVQITSVFAACLAIGRLSAGAVLRWISWFPLLLVCLTVMAVLLLVVMPLLEPSQQVGSVKGWQDVPMAAFVLPAIGLFMAPIYPAINSVVLSALKQQQQAAMTGLIVIFSALGGTLGSIITGMIFEYADGHTAFLFMLLPMGLLGVLLVAFRRGVLREQSPSAAAVS
ncbi:MFS transporter [Aestuariibacter halophilus]|uniref:MFS transporter n=1 Tax=Fluctibacter halophilus TaxID=226011 RepID=A0ABS8GCA0_9ALTE|nr:MFS transporter [Aestuariibacter halophilus]MCC2618034.1 MFS transporter [Aestuariibacter halophilus]